MSRRRRNKARGSTSRSLTGRVVWLIGVAGVTLLAVTALRGWLGRDLGIRTESLEPAGSPAVEVGIPAAPASVPDGANSTGLSTVEVSSSDLATVPGLADRTQYAPLADLFAKADPSADAQWLSEQFSAAAGEQLQLLGRLGEQPAAIVADSVSNLVADAYQSAVLRPSTQPVFRDGTLVVLRQQGSSEGLLRGRAGFVQGFRDLLEIYSHDDANHVHLKFKIIGAELGPDRAHTTAYVEIHGDSQSHPGRECQQTALWQCEWVRQQDGDQPLLRSVTVSDYEEVQPDSGKSGAFIDCTESLLGANSSYREQLVYGADHWYGNFDVAFGIHHGNQGLALGDADGDGREDLFLCQPAGLPNRLYLQQPDGTLLDRTKECGLDWLDASRGALFVDFDNDGDQDLVVSLNYSLVIFENLGGARFDKRTRVNIFSWPTSIAAADYDHDGDLDLYICGYNPRGETAPGDIFANPVPYHDANNGARNFMMRNEGNWDFLDVTQAVGLDQNNHRFTFAAAWEDYDNDGDLDLYVANDFGRNILYRNDIDAEGRRHFEDVSRQAGVEDIAAGMSVSWGDYNHDGWMDLYVSNMWSSAGHRITSQSQFQRDADNQTREEMQRHARGNSLFQNQGDGTFRDVSVEAAVTMGRWAWGSLFADINNDGWEDLYVANGFFTTPDTGDL